jgi:hypothetical protein
VLDEPTLAAKMRANVKSFVLGRFDWPSIAAKLEAVYGSLARKSRAGLVNRTTKQAVAAQTATAEQVARND